MGHERPVMAGDENPTHAIHTQVVRPQEGVTQFIPFGLPNLERSLRARVQFIQSRPPSGLFVTKPVDDRSIFFIGAATSRLLCRGGWGLWLEGTTSGIVTQWERYPDILLVGQPEYQGWRAGGRKAGAGFRLKGFEILEKK